VSIDQFNSKYKKGKATKMARLQGCQVRTWAKCQGQHFRNNRD
ncbi:hypothetical protein CCACVL1_30611, partial [Corchorus capsularis]